MSARPSRPCLVALVLAAIAVSGCDLVYPWSSGSAPAAPVSLGAELTSFDTVALSWAAGKGIGAYEVSGRIADGSWVQLGFVPGTNSLVEVSLAADVPEGTELGFRVRAFIGDMPSDWSGEAVVARGLRPASSFTATFTVWPVSPGTPVQLAWQRGSTVATELVLERRTTRSGVEVATWTPLAGVAIGDVSYADMDTLSWTDGVSFEYRLRYLLGALESAPASARTDAAPPAPALGLTASCDGGLAVHLVWTPVTQVPYVKQVVVRERENEYVREELATLGPGVGVYDDTVPVGAGYTYWIVTRASAYQDSWSAPASVITGIGPFVPSTLELPGVPVDVDAEGRFTLVSQSAPLRAFLPNVAGWAQHDVASGGSWLTPRYLRATDGTASILYYAGYYSAPSRDWHDTAGWHTEALPFAPIDAVVDAAGALHLVQCGVYTDLTYATNRSGAWVSEPVPHTGQAKECALAIGPDGEPRIAYATPRPPAIDDLWDTGLVVHGTPGWQDGPGPLLGFPDGVSTFRLMSVASGATLFLGVSNAPDLNAYDLGPEGWSAAVRVGPYGSGFAVSLDGTRIAFGWEPGWGYPSVVAVRDANGRWATWSLPGGRTEGIGFAPSGKLWVAIGWLAPNYVVYTER